MNKNNIFSHSFQFLGVMKSLFWSIEKSQNFLKSKLILNLNILILEIFYTSRFYIFNKKRNRNLSNFFQKFY